MGSRAMPTLKCAFLEVYLPEWTLVEKGGAFSRNGEPPVASALETVSSLMESPETEGFVC